MRWFWTKTCEHPNTYQWHRLASWPLPWDATVTSCEDCGEFLTETPVPYVPPRMPYVDAYKALRAAYHGRAWR